MSNRSFKLLALVAIGAGAFIWWKQRNAQQSTNVVQSRYINQKSGTIQPSPGMYPGGFMLAPADFNGLSVHS